MNNPWYDRINAFPQTPVPVQQQQTPMMMNPMQAMMNPVAFVRQACPDVPDEIINDPNKVFQYLMNTRGLTPQQKQLLNQQPRRF